MSRPWEPMLLELHRSRRGRLLAFATALAGPNGAEDLVQEAVVATFSKYRGFESIEQAEQYVRRAIASRFVDHIRSASSARRRERTAAPSEAVPDLMDRVDTHDAVSLALASLPPRTRACVVLRYLEELSVRETARALGLSEGAVKRYVHDGIALLNAALGTQADAAADERVAVTTRREASK